MTAQTPAYLKTRFENGDIPVASDYEDIFDSYLNVATTAEQTIPGNIRTLGKFVGNVSANNFFASSFSTGSFGVTTISANTLYANVAKVTTVSANALYAVSAMFLGALDVSAVATTQAGALLVDNPLTFVTFASNNDNSVKLPPSTRGMVQRIVNASTTVLKVFPSVSGRFLVTAVNASLTLQADKTMTVFHQGNDRYGTQIG